MDSWGTVHLGPLPKTVLRVVLPILPDRLRTTPRNANFKAKVQRCLQCQAVRSLGTKRVTWGFLMASVELFYLLMDFKCITSFTMLY